MEDNGIERKHRKQRHHKRTNDNISRSRSRSRSKSKSPKKRLRRKKETVVTETKTRTKTDPEPETETEYDITCDQEENSVPTPETSSPGFLSNTLGKLWAGNNNNNDNDNDNNNDIDIDIDNGKEMEKDLDLDPIPIPKPKCFLERDGYRLMRRCKFFEGSSLSPFKAYIVYAHSNMKWSGNGSSDKAISFVPCVLETKEQILNHCDHCLLDLAVSVKAECHDVYGGVVVPLQFRDVYSPKLNDTDILRYKKGYDTTSSTKVFLVENVQFFDFSRGYCVALADNERECKLMLKRKQEQCRHPRSRSKYKQREPIIKYLDPSKPPKPIIGLSITLPGVMPTVFVR